jgi:hypothetical protein
VGALNRAMWWNMSSLLKTEIFSFLLKNSLLLKENYENGYKIMCLKADDWQVDVKNFQEFLKQSRYWGADSHLVRQEIPPIVRNPRFSTVFKTNQCCSLSWARRIQPTSIHITCLRSNLDVILNTRVHDWCF